MESNHNISLSPAVPEFNRGEYGEIICSTPEVQNIVFGALNLAKEAAKKGYIPTTFDHLEWEKCGSRGRKKTGEARYHEIYDVTLDMKKTLVCIREIEGTKYGVKTISKNYFLVKRWGANGIRVIEANKSVVAKIAKAHKEPGLTLKNVEAKSV